MAQSSQPTLPSGEGPPSTQAPREGSVLAERYRLIEQIGSGGMGSVWEGEHVALGTPVAVKLIKPAGLDDEQARARFLREARAAAALRSPNVVQIFDYGVHEGTPYIAMELLHGQSLAEKLRRRGALTGQETSDWMGDLMRAVAKAHDANVVHRDLKPDNVFIVDGGERSIAKVLDFGIAKGVEGPKLDTSTQEGAILGTPFYMSPEQLMDATLCDARSDLWSIAVITYECLLGHRPFFAESMPSLAVSLLATAPPVPSHRGDVPPGFDAWFEKATTRDPAGRFQNAREMWTELELVLSGRGSTIERRGMMSDEEKTGSGVPRVVAAVGVIGAVVLGWAALSGPEPSVAMEGVPPRPVERSVAEAPPTKPQPPPVAVPAAAEQPPAPAKDAKPAPTAESAPEPPHDAAAEPEAAREKERDGKGKGRRKNKSKPNAYDPQEDLEF